MTGLVVVGSEEDLALAGPPAGGAARSRASTTPDDVHAAQADAARGVVLGATGAPALAGSRVIHWLDGAAHAEAPAEGRLIAAAGAGLWRRAPWPVNDALFELAPAPVADQILVVGGAEDRRAAFSRSLGEHGVAARAAGRVTASALAGAATVVVLGGPEAPAPAALMAPLAAGRVLVLAAGESDFGLQAGVDHLLALDDREAVSMAAAAVAQAAAFDLLRSFGRLAAERHRASTAYRDLLTDVRLERHSAGAPAVP